MAKSDPLLQSFQLRHLALRNRIFSSAHAPSYAEDGHPKDRYRLYHEEKAKGGVALTMVGGSTNVAPDSPSVFGQLYAGDDSIIPWFKQLTDGVKSHGAAVMCQITHMGRRTGWDGADWLLVIGPSPIREQAHRSVPKEMEKSDIDRVVAAFAQAVRRCAEGGFDGIELLCHAHLLGQFLSPHTNKRNDDYGGSIENRTRIVIEVLDAVRAEVGSDIILGMRVTGDELIPDGLTAEDCVEIAHRLSATRHFDFLNTLAGAPYDDLGLAGWVPPMGYDRPVKLSVAQQIKNAVDVPVFYAGGINDLATARHAVTEDMVGMTRAHIADPHIVEKIAAGDEDRIRPCVGLGYCVDRVNQGKEALCGHNVATGREGLLQHKLVKTKTVRTVVVVGGGAAGLEAARVAASAGHIVHLYEASTNWVVSFSSPRRERCGVRSLAF
jgi:2,4-dienoyl-CoA reductase-like NADH-dependent reductase (Old Yellow Enzyme family)